MSIELVAQAVLDAAPPEANIRNRICNLLKAVGYDEFNLEYRIGIGSADIFLPRQRTIIETKTTGGADRPNDGSADRSSPFAQLDGYIQDEIANVQDSRFRDESDRRWVGILTDGRTWHSWSYEHREAPAAQPETGHFQPESGSELAGWLGGVLAGDPVGKPWIPRNPVEIFHGRERVLRGIYDGLDGRIRQETDTKVSLWRDMLRSSGMEPVSEAARHRLFSAHSFLIVLARGVVWTIEHPQQMPDPDVVLGDGIVSWVVQSQAGKQWARDLFARIGAYDWRRRRGDVLRPLYEAFVDKDDRRDFGEVYTPDWLAELLAREILDDAWCSRAISAALGEIHNNRPLRAIGVLDPCCGSGTFLYHATQQLLRHPDLHGQPASRQADIVSRLVSGMDIHPVACEFARATLLRALPAKPPGGESVLRIWNGDSLLLHQTEDDSIFAPTNGEVVFRSPRGALIELPEAFVTRHDFAEMIRLMTDAADEGRPLPGHIESSVECHEDRLQLQASHQVLTEVIANEGNSVWAWFMQQTVGPYLLARHKIDRILSNPPWVKMSTIQHVPRKRRLEGIAREIGLWQGGKQAPHTDIAQLFIKRCRDRYLQESGNDPAAWVVKHSAIKGGNWEKFRMGRPEDLANGQILDLAPVQVFGGGDAQKSCVLIDGRRTGLGQDLSVLVARCPGGRPAATASLEEAGPMITWEPAPRSLIEGPSGYIDTFRQGATIVPHVLLVADRIQGADDTPRRVTTRRSKQPSWKDVEPQTVTVPARWLVPMLRSDHLLPFALTREAPDSAIVPLDDQGQVLTDHDAARQQASWRQLDDIYQEMRGRGGRTPHDLLRNIDNLGKAMRQLPLMPVEEGRLRTRVIYPKSADSMRSCRMFERAALVNDTIYHATFRTEEEAAYLCALLNAPALGPAFVQSRRSGRDFHLHPWQRVPIPKFEPASDLHCELAALCVEAETATAEFLNNEHDALPGSQAARSRRIRDRLGRLGLFGRLDTAAGRLLPDQATES